MLIDVMNTKWQLLGIEDWFKYTHHFNPDHTALSGISLSEFVRTHECKNIHGQNQETVFRALEFAKLVQQGIEPHKAIKQAWKRFPLLKRETKALNS